MKRASTQEKMAKITLQQTNPLKKSTGAHFNVEILNNTFHLWIISFWVLFFLLCTFIDESLNCLIVSLSNCILLIKAEFLHIFQVKTGRVSL